MDIPREGVARRRRRRNIIILVFAAVAMGLASYGLYQVEPAAPTVDRSEVVLGIVARGELVRQVRGPGTLVPVEIRWIAVETEGRVERRVVLAGARVEPDTVILELSNPELKRSSEDAELQLRAAEAETADLEVRLQSELLNARAQAAAVQSDYRQADLQVEANEELNKSGLIPVLTLQLSQVKAEELANRNQIEQERLVIKAKSVQAQLASQQARLDQARSLYELRRSQFDALHVKAGIRGVLQEVPVELGQRVAPGTNLARVAKPEPLRAELRIPETQAKDLEVGQKAEVDTRNGLIMGRVERIDPAVQNGSVQVDVLLIGELPKGARPDLSVSGTIEIERLDDALYMGRPVYGQAHSTVGLFVVQKGGTRAVRQRVKLGRSSVSDIEVVSGLEVGEEVIISDTSRWDDFDVLRLD